MFSTVLIIDKRKELPAKYKKCIETPKTEVVISSTLKDGIEKIQLLQPDIIIVSDSIDEILGNFCERIRTLTYNTRPVIVALSKSADSRDRISVLEKGADDFLSEPVNIDEFKTRIKAHLRREIESNLDNKTLLPNQKLVKKALRRAIASNNSAVLLISIENLDNYKTVYTEVAADKLIQTFVAISKSALNENDFIGQLNDNTFVIIANKYSGEKLASFLVFAIDTVAPKFYSKTDSQRGYMLLEGNHYAGMRANFVSICIGGITDGFNLIPTAEALIEKLISVKNLAKTPSGSNYAIERVKISGSGSVVENAPNRNIYIKEKDDSLSYLIRTALELQGYDIIQELDETSRPSVIIMDSGDDLSELEFLRKIKTLQNFNNTKIIVTSTVHDKSTILGSGADLYLPKPYEISDLIRWVEYFIRK